MKGGSLKSTLYNKIYKISKVLFFTKEILKRTESRLLILYPSTRNSIILKTGEYLFKVYMFLLISLVGFLFFADFSIYYSVLTIILLYAIMSNRINARLEDLELKLLIQFEEFISELRFNYTYDKMVLESIKKCSESLPYEISLHADLLHNMLLKDYLEEDNEYKDVAPNSFFLTLYSLCILVLRYGDKENGKTSVFLENLGYLKEDLNLEILKRKKIKTEFSGLLTITIFPLFAIKPIEKWAMYNLPLMTSFYNGFNGIMTTLILGFTSIFIFKIITKLKYSENKFLVKDSFVEALFKYEIISVLILRFIRLNYKGSDKINKILKSISHPYDVKEFTLHRILVSLLCFFGSFIISISLLKSLIYSFLVGIIVGIVMYVFEYFKLVISKQIIIMEREEEIKRFQSIIIILKNMDRMNISEIILYLKNFAFIFRDKFEWISNKIPSKGVNVFKEVREETGFLPLKKLMDSFIYSDSVGIEKAFYDLESDRAYYIKKHTQETEFLIMKKVMLAKLISFIPICLVILLKLIIPFVLEGIMKLELTKF